MTELVVWITVLQSLFCELKGNETQICLQVCSYELHAKILVSHHVPREYIYVTMLYQNASVKYPLILNVVDRVGQSWTELA